MTVKPIAAGMPQRIIEKINELVNAVNTGGGSGTADTILDAATIADAGKALGIDAEGEPALITVEGGSGAPLLRCNLTYTGAGTGADPYVGHLNNASEILDALDRESPYDPIIVIAWDFKGQQGQCLPTISDHRIETFQGAQSETSYLNAYGNATPSSTSTGLLFMLAIDYSGADPVYMVSDAISQTNTQNVTIENDVIVFTDVK